jgi:4-amino-4-deoxy-L-arabinose transferase-like glycosyltransferase
MGNKESNKLEWIILVVCIISFFINNTVFVPDIMESRNIVAAREMVYDGNWMIPTMNGELRLEKPPLPTWLTALAEAVSPDNLGLQRAMAGLAACLLVFFFYKIGILIMHNKRYAFTSTLILCTCYNIILMGRTASWDIYCHAFMLGAVYFLIKAFTARDHFWKYYIGAGLFMGLSFMSKGPVSFYAVLLPFLLSYCYFYRPSMQGKWKMVTTMIAICLIIGSWWYLYIYLFHSNMMAYVAGKESSSWINHNVRSWFYYWDFFLEAGVWALLLLSAIFLPIWSKIDRKKKEYLFPYIWMIVTIILLSFFPEKKKRYLLPVMISASYIMGYLMLVWAGRMHLRRMRVDRIIYRINAWLVAVVVAALPIIAYPFVYRPGYISLPMYIVLSIIIWAITIYLIFSAVKLKPFALLNGLLTLFLIAECFMLPLLKNIVNNPEMKSIAETQDVKELKGIPFYYNQKNDIRIEMVYAAHRKIRPLDATNVDSVEAAMPCVILTHKRINEELPASLWKKADSTYIGRYDDNRRPKGTQRYSDSFIYHITLLKKK